MKLIVGLFLATLLIVIEPAVFYIVLLLAMCAAALYGIIEAVKGE